MCLRRQTYTSAFCIINLLVILSLHCEHTLGFWVSSRHAKFIIPVLRLFFCASLSWFSDSREWSRVLLQYGTLRQGWIETGGPFLGWRSRGLDVALLSSDFHVVIFICSQHCCFNEQKLAFILSFCKVYRTVRLLSHAGYFPDQAF